jgi:hypothetical protein
VAERNPTLIEDPAALVSAMKHESMSFVVAVLGMVVLYGVTLRLTAKNAN